MREERAVTLEHVVSLARRLPLLEKIRLIEQMAPDIERDMFKQQSLNINKRRSLLGLCVDLGPAPSSEDIDEIRHEM